MLERLMGRAKTSGREDDNKESIVKRFREFTSTKILFFLWDTSSKVWGILLCGMTGTFTETSMPVVDYYRKANKVVEVSCPWTRRFSTITPCGPG
jgi:UMP-CMP kinase